MSGFAGSRLDVSFVIATVTAKQPMIVVMSHALLDADRR
jgi:hypothetical protein